MLAISTSFVSSWDSFQGKDLVNLLERLDLHAVELEYRIPASRWADVKTELKHADIKVTSIHNFFPFTAPYPHAKPSGDLFNLADPDPEKRKSAVLATQRTIAHANDLEAGRVVLHCGWVEMDHECQRIEQYLTRNQTQSQEFQQLLQQKLEMLNAKKEKYLSALFFSLDKLMGLAEKEGVHLGLENRFHYHQLPTYADFDLIFRKFQGAPIGYWHDTGHAQSIEMLNLIEPGALLKNYSQHLIGTHLHDALGLDDHLPPGKGKLPFSEILSQIAPNAALVMELQPGTNFVDIQSGVSFLIPLLTQKPV